MRNPIRLKNLRLRFLPLYLTGLAILIAFPPEREMLAWAMPLIVLGTCLRSWGAGHLVKNDALTTTGPYAYLRHPLYLGTILVGTGFALAIGGFVSLLVLLALWPWFALHYFPRKERTEGSRLEALYGDRFVRYRAHVPPLLPRFRAWRDEWAPLDQPRSELSAGAAARVESEADRWRLDRYSDNNELGTLLAIAFGILLFWLRAIA